MLPVRRPPFLVLLLIICAPLLAACQTDGNGLPMAQAAPPAPKPLTRSQIAMQCWMALESGRKQASLDRRADIVTKCIDDRMNAAQPAPKA